MDPQPTESLPPEGDLPLGLFWWTRDGRWKHFVFEFLKETQESFVLLLFFSIISEKPLNRPTLLRNVYLSCVIGVWNVVMHMLDEDSHQKMKESMKSSVGGAMLASAMGRK